MHCSAAVRTQANNPSSKRSLLSVGLVRLASHSSGAREVLSWRPDSWHLPPVTHLAVLADIGGVQDISQVQPKGALGTLCRGWVDGLGVLVWWKRGHQQQSRSPRISTAPRCDRAPRSLTHTLPLGTPSAPTQLKMGHPFALHMPHPCSTSAPYPTSSNI